VDEGDDLGVIGDGRCDSVNIDWVPPVELHGGDFAVALGDTFEPPAELPVDDGYEFVVRVDEVGDGCLHPHRGGAVENQRLTALCGAGLIERRPLEHVFEAVLGPLVHRFELGGAV
jgi:hypothetical protein